MKFKSIKSNAKLTSIFDLCVVVLTTLMYPLLVGYVTDVIKLVCKNNLNRCKVLKYRATC